MDYRFIYMTAKDEQEARTIGEVLVKSRLAACVNILDGMSSLYWWKGQIQDDRETVLIAKTRSDLVDKLIAQVRKMHSYEVPCIVALPIVQGNPQYLDWIGQETRRD